MKNKLSILPALFFLLCTAMCCEEFEEYIPCQVTLTGIGKVEHLDNAGSVPVARWGEWYLARHICCGYPWILNMRKRL